MRLALAGGALVLVLFGVFYASLFTLGVLPRLGFAPGYALTDEAGARFTSEDVRGEVVLYTFASAQDEPAARDTAPVMAAVQSALRRERLGVPVRLVTVVLDAPAEALPALAEAAGAGPDWRFVTTEAVALQTAVRDGFGVWYEARADGRLAYDPVFVIADGFGIVRSRHRLGLPDPEVLLFDLRSIAREAEAATGAARLAYEAAHLFQCYPTR